MSDLFILASRQKFRFITPNGIASVEDLWDLPLRGPTSLNTIAQELHQEVQNQEQSLDFIDDSPAKDDDHFAQKLEIVKHVISTKKAEADAALAAADKARAKYRLVELLHSKKDDALKELSIEELEARIADL